MINDGKSRAHLPHPDWVFYSISMWDLTSGFTNHSSERLASQTSSSSRISENQAKDRVVKLVSKV
jgi:hypothetical protein